MLRFGHKTEQLYGLKVCDYLGLVEPSQILESQIQESTI